MKHRGVAQEIPQDVLKRAFEWQVALWSGEVTPQWREDFARWLAADALHERAWNDVQRVDGFLAGVPRHIGARVLRGPGARRKVLGGLAWAGAAGLLAAAVRETPYWQVAMADHATRVGEQREIELADGSRLTLNTASAVDVRFGGQQRLVVLRRGEIQVVTAADRSPARRAFLVQTRHGVLEPLGTRFSVRDEQRKVQLAVFEGAVEIRLHEAARRQRLAAGQQAAFDASSIGPAQPVDPLEAAWTRGLLVAEREPLADFLVRLGRYRPGVVRCHPAVAGLLVSGVYPLADTDRILAALEQVLPIRVGHATRYWVTVEPRS